MRKFVDITIICVLALCLCAFPASGHKHGQANHLKDAKNGNGAVCCNGEDYDQVLNWERTEKGYRVQLLNKKWVEAPAYTVVQNKRPEFEAKVWLYSDERGSEYHVR